MSVLEKIFGKKKKEFKAFCNVSREPVEKGYGFLLTTAQVVASRAYWDKVMTEPDTMSYTINHFKNNDAMATQIRNMIFEKYSGIEKPWIISDSCIHWFDVDKNKARQHAESWWASEGDYTPENAGTAGNTLKNDEFDEIRHYAVMEAGRERVR
ncbi:MAG: hypothetical protein OEX02_19850 [Cyclobacteriaceae bacterium]|nr:hypothetical protein [Cyclobacteriaceae bacterium]